MIPEQAGVRGEGEVRVKIYGHRGASGLAPENTIEAFRLALSMGVDGIEFDVRATADGQPVLIHDRSLERTAGVDRNVEELTLAELQGLAPQIPTLVALLELVGETAHLDIEVKQARIEERVLETLSGFPDVRWAISCFDWAVLERFRELSPGADIWLLANESEDVLYQHARRLGASGVAIAGAAIAAPVIERAHAAGLTVMAWTVNDVDVAGWLQGWGLDALCTDHPERWFGTNSVE